MRARSIAHRHQELLPLFTSGEPRERTRCRVVHTPNDVDTGQVVSYQAGSARICRSTRISQIPEGIVNFRTRLSASCPTDAVILRTFAPAGSLGASRDKSVVQNAQSFTCSFYNEGK